MDKLRDEMAKEVRRPEIGSVGEVMTGILIARPDAAAAILAKGKTLAGAYKALEDFARKNRGDQSCVYIGPERAAKILMDYYGIGGDAPSPVPDMARNTPEAGKMPAVELAAPDETDAFDLDALMGGV